VANDICLCEESAFGSLYKSRISTKCKHFSFCVKTFPKMVKKLITSDQVWVGFRYNHANNWKTTSNKSNAGQSGKHGDHIQCHSFCYSCK